MHNTEKYYGFKVKISDFITPAILELLKIKAAELAAKIRLLPKDYFIFVHRLTILANSSHFGVSGGIPSRIKEVALGFHVNKKQIKSKKLFFASEVYDAISSGGESCSKNIQFYVLPEEIVYFIPSSYFSNHLSFENYIITFMHHSLRLDHRKIKVSVTVRPTEEFLKILSHENSVCTTKLDARFEKDIQLNLPFVNVADLAIREDSVSGKYENMARELKYLAHTKKNSASNPRDIILIERAIACIEDKNEAGLKKVLLTGRHAIEPDLDLLHLEYLRTYFESNPQAPLDIQTACFKVAISYACDKRSYVEEMAIRLREELGENMVFYDQFYPGDLAVLDMDSLLQSIYHDRSDLNVIFLSESYAEKEWCGIEWRAIKDLVKKKKKERILLVKFDDVCPPGVYSYDGWLDAKAYEPLAMADIVLERIGRVLQPESKDNFVSKSSS